MNIKKNKTRQLITLTQFECVWLILLLIYFLRNLKKKKKKKNFWSIFFQSCNRKSVTRCVEWCKNFCNPKFLCHRKIEKKCFFLSNFFLVFNRKSVSRCVEWCKNFCNRKFPSQKKVSQSWRKDLEKFLLVNLSIFSIQVAKKVVLVEYIRVVRLS